jgi:hypothetical protein
MKRILALLVCSLVWIGLAQAEAVVVTPAPATLAAGGGELVLNVDIDYGTTPAALGLSLGLPSGWTLVGVSGEAAPPITPAAGTTENLEFAWMTAPERHAAFTLTVRYPAGSGALTLGGKVLLRRDGKSLELAISVPLSG